MDRLFNSIGELFQVIPRMATEELRRLRKSIVCLIGFLYAISLFHLAVNNYTASSIFGVIICALSLPVIFNIRRIVNLTIVGEALEALRITPVTQAQKAEEGSAAIVINPLSTIFWGVSLQVFFFILILSLATPLLPLRNNPLFIMLFPTMAIAIAIAFKGTALRTVNWISSVFVLILILVHMSLLFVPNAKTNAFGKTLEAYFSRSEISARQNAQIQRTSQIPPGTVIYNCSSSGDCSPTELKYKRLVAGILLNEHAEQNGVTYEKVSLPDPVTSQPGKIIGWIPTSELSSAVISEKLTEKAMEYNGTLKREFDFERVQHPQSFLVEEQGEYTLVPKEGVLISLDQWKTKEPARSFTTDSGPFTLIVELVDPSKPMKVRLYKKN